MPFDTEICATPVGKSALEVGHLVRSGKNATPVFRIVALDGNQAWVRDELRDADYIVPTARCHVVGW